MLAVVRDGISEHVRVLASLTVGAILACAFSACGSANAAYSVRQVKSAFADHGITLSKPTPLMQPGSGYVVLRRGRLEVLVRVSQPRIHLFFGTRPGLHLAKAGRNVVVTYPNADASAVSAALAELSG